MVAILLAGSCAAAPPGALYLDPSQPIEVRVADLLGRMTLEEKIGQINMPCVYRQEMGGGATNTAENTVRFVSEKTEACRKFTLGTHAPRVGPGGGFFTMADNILPEGPRQQATFFNELQRLAREKTRLGIPLLEVEEGTHGLMCAGGTVFPEGPSIGSTWDIGLVERIYAAAAREARAVGIHALFTLVVEPTRDPRLGRNEEGYSEDPFLLSRFAEAIVRGAQGTNLKSPDKVVAGLCHYPGQSQPASGLERGAMDVSDRTLREVFLPPWIAGIKTMGALGVMATYPAIDGVPAHSSEKLLTKILREELNFKGLVLGEGRGLSTLLDEKVVRDDKEVGPVALRAGVDVGISHEVSYMSALAENVEEGRVPMALLDRAVSRVLWLKFSLGLFDSPYVDVERAVKGVPRDAHRQLALEAARESIVLLKNERNTLPLRKDLKSIAVIGPNADDPRSQLGDYTSKTILQEVVSVLSGIKRQVQPGTQVLYSRGCDLRDEKFDQIAAARDAARRAQVVVVVLGEWHLGNGEGRDVASLDLQGRQEELVRAVYETGTPTVVVLINGRPLSTRWISEHIPAVVEAWLPGERGGQAVAELLFGDVNPSGKLAVSIPRHSGQLPVYYNHTPTKAARRGYVDMPASPLYPFGHGLSYTAFQYGEASVTPSTIRTGGQVRVRLKVTNSGTRAGAEVVQLYLRDVISSVTRPVKELRGFQKVRLAPGESQDIEFVLKPEHLQLLDEYLRPIVEPGTFEVSLGSSSEDIRTKGTFEVLP